MGCQVLRCSSCMLVPSELSMGLPGSPVVRTPRMLGPTEILPWMMQGQSQGKAGSPTGAHAGVKSHGLGWDLAGAGHFLHFTEASLCVRVRPPCVDGAALASLRGLVPAPARQRWGQGGHCADRWPLAVFTAEQFGTLEQICRINRREAFTGSPACPLALALCPAPACITARGEAGLAPRGPPLRLPINRGSTNSPALQCSASSSRLGSARLCHAGHTAQHPGAGPARDTARPGQHSCPN